MSIVFIMIYAPSNRFHFYFHVPRSTSGSTGNREAGTGAANTRALDAPTTRADDASRARPHNPPTMNAHDNPTTRTHGSSNPSTHRDRENDNGSMRGGNQNKSSVVPPNTHPSSEHNTPSTADAQPDAQPDVIRGRCKLRVGIFIH